MLEVPVLGLLLFYIAVLVLRKWRKPALSYPPGPKGYPILGNVLDLPQNVPFWESLTSLANRHGALPSYSVLRKFPKLSPERHRCPILTTRGRGHGRPEQWPGYFGSG